MRITLHFLSVFIGIFLLVTQGYSQSAAVETPAAPIGGIHKLALEYFKINFTKEQRKELEAVSLEFVYSIDEQGKATLEKVNGITTKAILDSLTGINNRLPGFTPGKINNEPVASIYFMKLQFPRYNRISTYTGIQEAIHYNQTPYEAFEYIHMSGERIEVSFGAVANTFTGNPAEYLKSGGGMKVGIMLTGQSGYSGGMNLSFYGNKLLKDYPINSNRKQNEAPPTMLFGISAGKTLMKRDRREFNLQLDLGYGIQNVTPRLGDNDQDWTQLSGFCPGFVANYALQFGKNKAGYAYATPSIINHHLSFHGAVRPLFFNLKAARGVMLELGLSYLLRNNLVDEYRIKPKPETN